MEERADDQCQRKTVPDGGGPEHSGRRGEEVSEAGGIGGGRGEARRDEPREEELSYRTIKNCGSRIQTMT